VGVALLDSLLLLLLLGLAAPVHAASWYVGRCRELAVLQPSRPAPLLLTGLPHCVHAPSLDLQDIGAHTDQTTPTADEMGFSARVQPLSHEWLCTSRTAQQSTAQKQQAHINASLVTAEETE
jgi:hypothetical protein